MDLTVASASLQPKKIELPPSKLYTQMACAAALLAKGKNIIESPLKVGDTQAMLKAAEQLGATVNKTQEKWSIWGPDELRPAQGFIDAKNSATGLALLASVMTLSPEPVVLNGDAQLRSRAMPVLLNAFRRMGAEVYSTKSDDSPPLLVMGGGLKGGKIKLDAVEARYLPALALPAPYARKEVELGLGELGMTFAEPVLEIMSSARVKPRISKYKISVPRQPYRTFRYAVRREVTGAAPIIIAAGFSEVKFRAEKVSARDELFLKALESFGMKCERKGRDFTVWKGKLMGAELDLSWAPELLPLMAVLALMSKGRSVISDAAEARTMKSDRISATAQELRKMGGKVLEQPDGLVVQGPTKLKGCEVDGHDDYMVVAALAVAGMFADGKTVVNGADALGTSSVRFVAGLRDIGAEVSYS